MDSGMKICPRCRCEYFATVEQCADCGVALVDPGNLPAEPTTEELPPASEMVPLRIASVPFASALSDMLQAAGISHRLDSASVAKEDEKDGRARRQSHDQGVAVFVLPEDLEAAREIDAEFLRVQIPDQPADPSHSEEHCPACGDPLAPDAAECPGCGLPFLEVD